MCPPEDWISGNDDSIGVGAMLWLCFLELVTLHPDPGSHPPTQPSPDVCDSERLLQRGPENGSGLH